MVMVTRQPPPSYVPMVMVMMVMIFTYYWLYIRICICITLSPSLAARCSDTQRRAFRAALPLPMLGFGSSTASSTAPECRRRFFCRISSSGVSMYVSVWGRGSVYVYVGVLGGGVLSQCHYTQGHDFIGNLSLYQKWPLKPASPHLIILYVRNNP